MAISPYLNYMITLEANENLTALIMRYNYAYRGRVAQVPGYRFDYTLKAAVVPISSLTAVETIFKGEIYYKTPKWMLHGEKEPPKEEIHYFREKAVLPTLKYELFDYQKDGVSFMIDRIQEYGFVLNADSVGLGKTLQSIATMVWYMQHKGVRKVLIICKKSLKYQWESEIHKFTDLDIPIFVTGDTKKKRMKAYEGMQNCSSGILITSYHNYLNDTDIILKDDYGFCIIDEVHSLKARNGVMHQNIIKVVRGKRIVLLTGTPVMSKPDDIFGIVTIADKEYFGKYTDFRNRYLVMEYGIYGYQIIGAKRLDELQARIQSFMIRRTNYDIDLNVPEELPPTTINVPMDNVQTRMMEYVKELKQRLDDQKAELLEKYGEDAKAGFVPERVKEVIENINTKSKMYIATMQFISDDPYCFRMMSPERGINKDLLKYIPKNYTMSSKTESTIELVENIVSADEKVIIFCHFATPARMLRDRLQPKLEKIIGSKADDLIVLYTGLEGDVAREKNLKSFRESSTCKVMIATEAAAEGLNLQVAKYMIHYEQADTYAQRRQRIGRIKRIGSKYSHISIYDMCSEGSFDVIKIKKLERDKMIASALIGE